MNPIRKAPLLFAVAGALRRALHPRLAGSGDIKFQDSYKAFRKMVTKGRIEGCEGEAVPAEPDDRGPPAPQENFSATEDMSLREKRTNCGALLDDGLQG